jgi:hypothetical protein
MKTISMILGAAVGISAVAISGPHLNVSEQPSGSLDRTKSCCSLEAPRPQTLVRQGSGTGPGHETQKSARTLVRPDYLTPYPESLAEYLLRADAIVLGKVNRVLRQHYVPMNLVNAMQSTVFEVDVETTILNETPFNLKPLKVGQLGGDLPNGSDRAGMRVVNEPLLQVGQRYLLFLNDASKYNPAARERGFFESTKLGVTGKAGDVDELSIVPVPFGALLIEDGFLKPAREPGFVELKPWGVRQGNPPMLFGLTEADAIEHIRANLPPSRRGH